MGFGYIDFDDPVYTYRNPFVVSGLTLQGMWRALGHPLNGMWHTLTVLSFMMESQFFGLRPGIFHLTNLWIHVANGLVLYGVVRRLGLGLRPAALVHAIFAWHPTCLESVAWIAERKGLLSALFGLLCLAA